VRTALFAYGSLVNRASVAQTLGAAAGPPIPAELTGWHRRWSLARDNVNSEKTFARADDGTVPPYVLALNLEPAPDRVDGPNGALIELDEEALARLDLRELRYERFEVTGQLGAAGEAFDRVVAYKARPENFAKKPPAGAVILAPYLNAVEAAFEALAPDALARWRETTAPPPVEVIEPVLVEEEIPPGNPRAW
jgi:hypothetical protein